MERTPIIFLMFLIFLVIISAFVGADNNGDLPWERRGDDPVYVIPLDPEHKLNGRPPGPFFIQNPQLPNDERSFIEDNIAKSEVMAQRLEETINRLKAEGNDVEKLEDLAGDYTLLVEDSRMYFEKARSSDDVDSTSSASGSVLQEQEYLEMSRKSIIQANLLLKDIFHVLKPYLALHARIADNDTLSAEGTGTAVLSGDLDVDMSLSNGKLSYVDFRDDVSIELETATGPELACIPDMKEELVSYNNVSGNITLSGSGFIMELTGDDIFLVARGDGEAELFGNGTYFTGNDEIPGNRHIWNPPLFEND